MCLLVPGVKLGNFHQKHIFRLLIRCRIADLRLTFSFVESLFAQCASGFFQSDAIGTPVRAGEVDQLNGRLFCGFWLTDTFCLPDHQANKYDDK